MIPAKDKLTICFAHVAYRLDERFRARGSSVRSFEVRDAARLSERIAEADVLVVSGLLGLLLLWPNTERARLTAGQEAAQAKFA